MLLRVLRSSIRVGSHSSRLPIAARLVVMLTRSVSGLFVEGVISLCYPLAFVAWICSGVADMVAKHFCLLGCEGRYLMRVGALVGSSCQACVSAGRHWSSGAPVSIMASLGETMMAPLVRCCTLERA